MKGIERSTMGLKDINSIQPIYFIPSDNFVGEVLIPCLKRAKSFKCMLGFFSSASLREIAPGLAEFLNNQENKMHLLISPYISGGDQKALQEGVTTHPEILEKRLIKLFGKAYISESALVRYTLDCLAYLIATNQLEIKIIFISNALFHPKIWILSDGYDTVVAHGSVNMTQRALTVNYEHITVELSWADKNQAMKIERFVNEFKTIWSAKRSDIVVTDLPEAIRKKLLTEYQPDSPPTPSDFFEAWRKDNENDFVMPESLEKLIFKMEESKFHIPSWLRFREGDFAHQGKAVDAWCSSGFRGVLEMATGSGKTITAMICAHRLFEEHKPLLIVVAAPYIPIIEQWCGEIEPFGLKSINLTTVSGAQERGRLLKQINRRLRTGITTTEALVVSHDTLCSQDFIDSLRSIKVSRLLIADEAHNLGRLTFIQNPPKFFEYRLALSATPVRQYDDVGTEAIFKFFGPVVFQFTLREAIGRCLVEYDYFIHPIHLTNDEMDRWYEITEKIKQNAWRIDDGKPDDYLAKLYRDRRLLLETAQNKIEELSKIFDKEDIQNLHHTLIYASDKEPQQLKAVNELLRERGILFHQLTAEETADRVRTKQIIDSFQNGDLQVLTAKRVLDEGVNIPQIVKAFILASTTVERQWVQRRGRLLRTCKEIGKTHSIIHDFLALPPQINEGLDHEARPLVRSELNRLQAFASLARNAGRADGALPIIHELVTSIYY